METICCLYCTCHCPGDTGEEMKPGWDSVMDNELWELSETKETDPFLAPSAGEQNVDKFYTVNVGLDFLYYKTL